MFHGRFVESRWCVGNVLVLCRRDSLAMCHDVFGMGDVLAHYVHFSVWKSFTFPTFVSWPSHAIIDLQSWDKSNDLYVLGRADLPPVLPERRRFQKCRNFLQKNEFP